MLLSILAACAPADTPTVVPAISPSPAGNLPTWIQIYFTDPASPNAKDYAGGPDEVLAEAIDQARLSVDVAAYSLNLWSIRDALIHAHHRGVVVRMVMESDNMDAAEVQDLLDAEIPIVGDRRQGLMHDKFVVIDHSEVWTGSMNFTVSGAYQDNNNLIHIHSEQVAADYTARFEAMFRDDQFGPDALPGSPFQSLTLDGTPVKVLFSPADGVAGQLLALIQNARESIFFLAYTFTSNGLGEALVERAQAGVKVAGVMDKDQVTASQGTEYDTFMQAGLDVRKDGNTFGLMHHKVFIIDGEYVVTGSYNFTASAETTNDENVVIIANPFVAAKFMEEFKRLYDQAQHGIQTY